MSIRKTTYMARHVADKFESSTLRMHGAVKIEKRQQTKRERLMKQIQEYERLSKASMACSSTSPDSFDTKECSCAQLCNFRRFQHKKLIGNFDQASQSSTPPMGVVFQPGGKVKENIHSEAENPGSKHEELKPWETLVLGANLGDNLSRVEQKDREILQQRFILEWCCKNEPGSVAHQERLLQKRIRERAEIEDDEKNNLPRDKLNEREAIPKRLATLRWALKSSQSADQATNIQAAIEGYNSGEIGVTSDFTLIYGGRIVEVCPSYQSFTINRDQRLDAYYKEFGPGWLWYEPPLAGSGRPLNFAKKGFCLDQEESEYWRDQGLWAVNMRFVANQNKVCRSSPRSDSGVKQDQDQALKNQRIFLRSLFDYRSTTDATTSSSPMRRFPLKSTVLRLMFDTGATFPMICEPDLEALGVDPATYAAQTVENIFQSDGTHHQRFLYEMHVGIGAALQQPTAKPSDGPSAAPLAHDKPVGWPHEPGILGGLFPVGVLPVGGGRATAAWYDRLSGFFPLKACYASAVPATGRLWLGESRKEVLGAARFPPYHRYDTALRFDPGVPAAASAAEGAAALATPDGVVFVHRIRGSPAAAPAGGAARRRHSNDEGEEGEEEEHGDAQVEQFVDHDLHTVPGRSTYQRTINGKVVRESVRQFGPGPNLPTGIPKFPDDPVRSRDHDYWLRKYTEDEAVATTL